MSFTGSRFKESAAISSARQRGAASARRSRREQPSTLPPAPAVPTRRRVADPLRIEQHMDAMLDREQARLREQQRCLLDAPDPFEEQAQIEPRVYMASKSGRVIGARAVAAFRESL
jgi:hypothetical protein